RRSGERVPARVVGALSKAGHGIVSGNTSHATRETDRRTKVRQSGCDDRSQLREIDSRQVEERREIVLWSCEAGGHAEAEQTHIFDAILAVHRPAQAARELELVVEFP